MVHMRPLSVLYAKEKKWKEADEIREELAKKGILLDDNGKGTKWKLAK